MIYTNPRDIAVESLRDRSGNVTAHVDRLTARSGLSPADRSLARELALGTIRRQATLEAILKAFLAQPSRRLPTPLTEILHVALYQILFLTRVPDFAAVNEAVEQAGRYRHRRQSGLVNGVLRTIVRSLSELQQGPPPPAQDVIPIGTHAYRTAGQAIFPDPAQAPAEYLAAAYSLPEALTSRWIQRFGSLEAALPLAQHADARAPLTLRVNALKADLNSAAEALRADGAEPMPHSNGLSLVLPEHRNVMELAAFRDGLVQPQDATATAVCLKAHPRQGQQVLDFCAAPGTKTTHLAELMGNLGAITAVDVSEEKLAMIESNCRRLGVTIVTTRLAEQAGSLPQRHYDLVLADVPCSNTGVLARRPEARWRFSEQRLSDLVRTQQALAQAAAWFVRPGGRLVYSTCSIEPEECSGVARWLPNRVPHVRLVDESLTLPAGADEPANWRDGGYVAVFEAR